jgi:imidazolonepropionase-like amidohydrolase
VFIRGRKILGRATELFVRHRRHVNRLTVVPWRTALLAAVLVPAGMNAQSTPIVVTDVNVVPMDSERVVARQSVVVEGGVITHIGPAGAVAVPHGALTIGGSRKYLLPGLVDVHVHLASNPENEQQQILKLFLANGVTTVVNLRGIPQILDLRKAVAEGRILGPRIYTAGPFVNEPFFTTPDEVEREVVAQKRAGYDFIKIHGSLSRAAYARLNAVARREGIRVVGHIPRNLGVGVIFEERQYMVAHGEEFLYDTLSRSPDSTLPKIEAQIPRWARAMAEKGIWLTPNLTAYKAIALQVKDLNAMLARPEMRYLPRNNRTGWGPATNPYTTRTTNRLNYPGLMAHYRVIEEIVRGFHAAGVGLLVGTDAMNTGVVPGFSVHDELADLVAAGLTPYEALRAATANAAKFLAEPGDSGTVSVGQKADLLLLDANPLQDIANTRRIAGVMARGRWLPQAAIAKMLQDLASAP